MSTVSNRPSKKLNPLYNPLDMINSTMFFALITKKPQVGRDFLREMSIPVSSDNTVFLPLNVRRLPPGRCIMLSPFGHKSVIEFHCGTCRKIPPNDSDLAFKMLLSGRQTSMQTPDTDEANSLPLTVFNNAPKVIQHKLFYLSLLSQSMDMLRASFKQPGLFYAHFILAKFCPGGFPVFKRESNTGLLSMITVYRSQRVHVGEGCLQALCENMPEYNVSIDITLNKVYIVVIEPRESETKLVSLQEESICDAVAALDCSDEMKQELITMYNLV